MPLKDCQHILIYMTCALCLCLHTVLTQDYAKHPCNRDCSVHTEPMRCEYNLTIDWHTVLSRSCRKCSCGVASDCFRPGCVSAAGIERSIKVVNKMLPGPAVQVCLGDEIVANVANRMHSFESTSIHWHGMKQQGTPHMDGVSMITQCPIPPFTTFQYRFTARDSGTHHYHAHSSGQRGDGIFGALIVRQTRASDVSGHLYDHDLAEHVMVLNDWARHIFIDKYATFVHAHGSESVDAILVNGRGVDTNAANAESGARTFDAPRAQFRVQAGWRYRFRVVNSGLLFCPIELSIDEHSLLLIEVDGSPVEPREFKSLVLGAGERVDFVLHANQSSSTASNYWIKLRGLGDCEDDSIYQTAVLHYDDDDDALPEEHVDYSNAVASSPQLDALTTFNPLDTLHTSASPLAYTFVSQLESNVRDPWVNETLTRIRAPVVDKKLFLALDMLMVHHPHVFATPDEFEHELEHSDDPFRSPQINNISFMMPNTPLLYPSHDIPSSKFCNAWQREPACSASLDSFCHCIHVVEIDLNDVVELIVVDGGTQQESHPIHLHGHSFAVLGQEKLGDALSLDVVKEMDRNGSLQRNLLNPPIKDTLMNPSAGYSVLRFHANNPGYWVLHCHIDFHSEAGMMMVFKVGHDTHMPPMPDNWPQFGDYKVNNNNNNNKKAHKSPACGEMFG